MASRPPERPQPGSSHATCREGSAETDRTRARATRTRERHGGSLAPRASAQAPQGMWGHRAWGAHFLASSKAAGRLGSRRTRVRNGPARAETDARARARARTRRNVSHSKWEWQMLLWKIAVLIYLLVQSRLSMLSHVSAQCRSISRFQPIRSSALGGEFLSLSFNHYTAAGAIPRTTARAHARPRRARARAGPGDRRRLLIGSHSASTSQSRTVLGSARDARPVT